jgi:hypothetical protein
LVSIVAGIEMQDLQVSVLSKILPSLSIWFMWMWYN